MRSVILYYFVLFTLIASAQPPAPETIIFKMKTHGKDQGSEEYKISGIGAKHVLTSTVRLQKLGQQVLSTQHETLAADWSPLDYSLKTTMGQSQRSTEASVSAGAIHMKTEAQGEKKDQSVALTAPAWVIDNVVPSHFQVLINQYNALRAQKPVQFQLLVPQVPTHFTGTLSSVGTDTGTLNARRVQLRKYVLETKGLDLQIWADNSGQLMRVYLPQQDTEFIRAGFTAF
jgi:hypothetical protein